MPTWHIIFDLYGTLLVQDFSVCTPEYLKAHEELRHQWDVADREVKEFFVEYAEKHHLDAHALFQIREQLKQEAKLPVGIRELLTALRETATLHLLSNTAKDVLDMEKRFPQLFSLFASKTYSYHLRAKKPDFRVFKAVLRKTGAKPEHCIMIGDTIEDDIIPAKALGMHTIHFVGIKDSVAKLQEQLAAIMHNV